MKGGKQRGGDTSDTLYRIVSLYRVYRCISLYRRTYRRLASRRPVRIRGQIYIEYRMYHTLMYRDTALYTTDTSQKAIHQRRYITDCTLIAPQRVPRHACLCDPRANSTLPLFAHGLLQLLRLRLMQPPAVPFTRRDSQRWDGALLFLQRPHARCAHTPVHDHAHAHGPQGVSHAPRRRSCRRAHLRLRH